MALFPTFKPVGRTVSSAISEKSSANTGDGSTQELGSMHKFFAPANEKVAEAE